MLSPPQRVIIAICVPAIVITVVLFLEVRSSYQGGGGWVSVVWYARESWWVWLLAIIGVTAFELFLWRKR